MCKRVHACVLCVRARVCVCVRFYVCEWILSDFVDFSVDNFFAF